MWWGWGQITLIDCVLLAVLIPLITGIIGYGFFKILSFGKKPNNGLLQNFDIIQKINLYIIFGIASLFFIVLIFSAFNMQFFTSTVAVALFTLIGLITKIAFKPGSIQSAKRSLRFMNKWAVIVLFLFILVTVLSSSLITGFYGSGNTDGADHTFLTKLVLDNPNILWSHCSDTYNVYQIKYPLGTHVFSAFFVFALNIPLQKVVELMAVILPSLIALSFYSTIKCLFSNKLMAVLGLIISGFLSVGFSFAPIWWSGLPLLLSLYLTVSILGFAYMLLIKKPVTWCSAFIVGMLLFITVHTYPVAFLIASLWVLVLISVKLLEKSRKIKWRFTKNTIIIFVAFFIPISLCIPFIWFIYSTMTVPVNYLRINTDSWGVITIRDRLYFNWANILAQSQYFSMYGKILAIAPYSLIVLFAALMTKISKLRFILTKPFFASHLIFETNNFTKNLALIYFFMVLIIGYLALSVLPIRFLLSFTDPERIWQQIYIFGVMLSSVVIFSLIYFLHSALKHLRLKSIGSAVRFNRYKVSAVLLSAVIILATAFVTTQLFYDQADSYSKIKESFDRNALSESDLSLMKWVSVNTPPDSRILISQVDGGQYITAVTSRVTVAMLNYTAQYLQLMEIMFFNASDTNAIPLLVQLNVTYVYIGSMPMVYDIPQYIYRQFNATQMLQTPYFSLVKQYGNASLFYFNATLASNVYATVQT
jgi:hypothetical protein